VELWQGDLSDFIDFGRSPALVNRITAAFVNIYKRRPPESEIRSWNDSLAAVADVADKGLATDDVGVVVEYHLPLSDRRIDVMFFGTRDDGVSNSLLLELKRWDCASLEGPRASRRGLPRGVRVRCRADRWRATADAQRILR
jgi:hypothetical protein